MKGATIRRLAVKALAFARKATPYVLATLSAAGTVAVTVEAVKEIRKNTPKVYYAKQDEIVEDLEQKGEDGTIICIANNTIDIWKHKIVDYTKAYWKPVIFCLSSIACQAGSVFIFTKRQQRLIIATHQLENLLRRYTDAAAATAGVAGTAVVNKLSPVETPPFDPDVDNDGLTLFWDPVFDYWFRADERDFLRASKDTSHSFVYYGAETAENFYLRMGADPPVDKNGDGWIGWGWYMDDDWVSGWCEYSGYIDIDFSNKMMTDDGLEYRQVQYFQEPYFNMEICYAAIKVH